MFSTVRSNSDGRLGFLTDPRRLNVAITRARRGLVVIGNPDTLSRDRLWSRWLKWVAGQGCVQEEGWGQEGGVRVESSGGRGGNYSGAGKRLQPVVVMDANGMHPGMNRDEEEDDGDMVLV